MLATLPNRRGIIASVEPFDGGPEDRMHLICPCALRQIERLRAISPAGRLRAYPPRPVQNAETVVK
jgi:hypothetical protein